MKFDCLQEVGTPTISGGSYWAGGPPTFWPLWVAPISGPPTLWQLPRHFVKDTHNYSFTSCIPARWLLWHSDITKFNFGRGSTPDPAGRAYDAPPGPVGRGILPRHSQPPLTTLVRGWPAHYSDASAAYDCHMSYQCRNVILNYSRSSFLVYSFVQKDILHATANFLHKYLYLSMLRFWVQSSTFCY